MRMRTGRLLAAAALLAAVAMPAQAGATTAAAQAAPNWQFVWGDTFDSSLDPQKWGALEGTTNPGSDQAYASFDVTTGSSNLVLTTEKRQYGSKAYTSGMVWTKGRFSFTYGKIEVVAKVPPMGTGIWPALWLQGDKTYNWPGPGGNEIDFAEMWNTPYKVKHALHYADTPNGTDLGANQGCTYESSVNLSAGYHTYSLVWEPGPKLTYFVDGQQTCQFSPAGNYFNTPMHIIMNTAVGASWIGHPDASVPFPQQFKIDSVRVYQDANLG
ncbi:glycoside hydrolase family 16 protein [Streptosporangium soli]|nr:glycoside hydrolase family 16 protein [Streptosporangium sp. KLBMP 9127]